MDVLVDTCVWSLVLRRHKNRLSDVEQALIALLADLIRDDRVRVIGPIRQELLTGIREPSHYEKVREYLQPFSDEAILTTDYERAAKFSNQCRARGISGSAIDLLICAVAAARKWQILTTDTDFKAYSKSIPISTYSLPNGAW